MPARAPERVRKAATADLKKDFDFSKVLAPGETVQAVLEQEVTPSGTLSIVSATAAGKIAQVVLTGGTPGSEYVVRVKVQTSQSQTPDLEGQIEIY